MLNANILEISGRKGFLPFYGRFPALKINPVRKVGST
jgi:hypothetical protein